MTKLWLLAQNSFRETLRQKLFLNVLVFGGLMIAFAQVVGNLTYGRADRVVRSIGLSGTALALDLLAILIGVALIHREIERRTALVVLTRPVSRPTFVFGRYLGLALSTLLATAGFAAVFALTLLSVRGQLTLFDGAAVFGAFLEALTIGAFATLLSCLTTPSLGTGMSLGFWISAASIDDVVGLTEEAGGFGHRLAEVLSYALPNLNRLNFREAAIYQEGVGALDVLRTTGYTAAFIVIFLLLASLALRRKELL